MKKNGVLFFILRTVPLLRQFLFIVTDKKSVNYLTLKTVIRLLRIPWRAKKKKVFSLQIFALFHQKTNGIFFRLKNKTNIIIKRN